MFIVYVCVRACVCELEANIVLPYVKKGESTFYIEVMHKGLFTTYVFDLQENDIGL